MDYELNLRVYTEDRSTASKAEIKAFLDWIQEVAPSRIDALKDFIEATDGGNPVLDFSRKSLGSLGEWFCTMVETRLRSDEEVLQIKRQQKFSIEIPSLELTDRTLSLCFDLALYFATVMLSQHPSLRWDCVTTGKRDINYGWPVLITFSTSPLNPFLLMRTYAYGIAKGSKGEHRLIELYDIWSSKIIAV